MNNSSRVHRVSLSLASQRYIDSIDFHLLREEINAAKDEFNLRNQQKYRMVMLKPMKRYINLIIHLTDMERKDSKIEEALRDFSDILINDYGWEKYCERRNKLFRICKMTEMDRDSCMYIINDLKETCPEYLSKCDLEIFVENANLSGPKQEMTSQDLVLKDRKPYSTIQMLWGEVKKLIGAEGFKNEVRKILNYYRLCNQGLIDQEEIRFSVCYIFNMQSRYQLRKMLGLFGILLSRLDLVDGPEVVYWDIRKDPNYIRIDNREITGIVCIDHISGIDIAESDTFKKAIELFEERDGKRVYVFLENSRSEDEKNKFESILGRVMYCRQIDIYEDNEDKLIEYGRQMFKEMGFNLLKGAENKFMEYFNHQMSEGSNDDALVLMDNLVNKITMDKALDVHGNKPETTKAFKIESKDIPKIPEIEPKGTITETDPFEELRSLVGLESVKRRVDELTASLYIQKERENMCSQNEAICMHMMFTGNPGTGKTTVARIIGRIFKKIGLLEKGDFFELGREDLIAKYVGHTAINVRNKVREAYGSVLFIDEAYSLNAGHEQDFGREAIATLIREMENSRDKLIVIFAGYTNEMEAFMNMNPGLRDRIPHKIHFPDYNLDELSEVLYGQLEEYYLEEGVKEGLGEIIEKELKCKSANFSNGRYVRNIAEKVKLKQRARLFDREYIEYEDMITILPKDVDELMKDADTFSSCENENEIRRIGF